jgi:hypothetical protein
LDAEPQAYRPARYLKELDEVRWAARQSSGHGQQGLSDLLEEEDGEGEAGGEGGEAQAGGRAPPGGDGGDGQSEGSGSGIEPPPDPMEKLFVWFGEVCLFTRPWNSEP